MDTTARSALFPRRDGDRSVLSHSPSTDAALNHALRLAAHQGRQDELVDEHGPVPMVPLSRLVRDHILRVYRATGCNKTRTARILEVDIKTIYNKLKRYGVD